MKILWSVNTLMPNVAEEIGVKSTHAISWVDAMSKELVKDKDVVLSIVSASKIEKFRRIDLEGIVYYVLPLNNLEKAWKEVIDDFSPDVIHIYGTEQSHNIPLLEMGLNIPILISLQGILKGYERVYYGGIDISEIIKNITLRDVIRGSIFKERNKFRHGADKEAWQLQHVKYVEGRSTWDRVYALSINPDLQYFYCPRLIRAPFYKEKWDTEKMESHTIFVHQGNYPIKGLHFVFEAMPTIIKKYPDVKLYVAGFDILNKRTIKERLLRNGYSKYLYSLYRKYNLSEYVHFLGRMSAKEVAEKLSRTNVMVIPSVIENCPNSLAEAMLVGTPSVASYVGGNAELLNNGECGELYCYNEPLMLANSIDKIFSSNELASQYSSKARSVAMVRHNPETLKKTLLSIYNKIIIG